MLWSYQYLTTTQAKYMSTWRCVFSVRRHSCVCLGSVVCAVPAWQANVPLPVLMCVSAWWSPNCLRSILDPHGNYQPAGFPLTSWHPLPVTWEGTVEAGVLCMLNGLYNYPLVIGPSYFPNVSLSNLFLWSGSYPTASLRWTSEPSTVSCPVCSPGREQCGPRMP